MPKSLRLPKKNLGPLCLHNEESGGLPQFYDQAMPRRLQL